MQHRSLTPERWAGFPLDRQLLMIANEMNRAGKMSGAPDRESQMRSYERVLELVDFTVATLPRRALMRELLRWRDLVAALYIESAERGDRGDRVAHHRSAFRCLLQFTPETARQIPYLDAGPPAG
jgi:hypothetical protein